MTVHSSQAANPIYTSQAAVLVVGDTQAARARGSGAVSAAGLRVLASLDVPDALARLDEHGTGAALFVELDGPSSSPALEEFLVRLNDRAAAGRHASVVSSPAMLIDLVAALVPHPRVHQLAGADAFERAAVLAIVASPETLGFRDSANEDEDASRLRRLTEEVGRIAGALARLSSDSARRPKRADRIDAASDEPIDAEEIRGMIRARRMRAQYFDSELFADPAWDMLLDLMAAHVDGQRVAVSSLCIAAAVPATTALRWIKSLTDTGVFVRRADPADGRRVFIELGEDSAKGMRDYLSALKRLANAPGMGLAQMAV